MDAGGVIPNKELKSFYSAFDYSETIKLLILYKDRIINKKNAARVLECLIKVLSEQESGDQSLEEFAISIAQQYNLALPLAVFHLPYKVLQKLMRLLKFSFHCSMVKELMDVEDFLRISRPSTIIDYKYKNLGLEEGTYTKVPSILHHIWLTHPNNPKQIQPKDIDNAIKTQSLFNSSTLHSWQQIIWVNDIKLLQPSVNRLANTGIVVR